MLQCANVRFGDTNLFLARMPVRAFTFFWYNMPVKGPMPFSPSDFVWWMWLLFAVGAVALCIGTIAAGSTADSRGDRFGAWVAIAIALASGIVGIGCLIIGIVRFVKWAWSG
jgi:hypothetical protein